MSLERVSALEEELTAANQEVGAAFLTTEVQIVRAGERREQMSQLILTPEKKKKNETAN